MKKRIKEAFLDFNNFIHKDKRVFAKGICFEKLLFVFIIGSVIGVYYEQILNLIIHYIKDGSIYWQSRRGVIYGPLSPIYGAGFVIMVYYLAKKELKSYQIFLRGALIGGVFEYIVSFLQETFIGTRSWNYSGYFLNINGRTTIPYMVVWGLLCLFMIKKAYPFFSGLIEKIPYNLGNILVKVIIIFLILDFTVSWSALIRQNLRRSGHPQKTIIDKFYDTYYNDNVLRYYFPNMKPSSINHLKVKL